jgi:hypothetical protein
LASTGRAVLCFFWAHAAPIAAGVCQFVGFPFVSQRDLLHLEAGFIASPLPVL